MPKLVSPQLLDFKAQLDLHRQSHSPRSRIPEHLWQQAVGLLDHHSASAICRFTHLHPEGLLKRAAGTGAKSQAPDSQQTFLHLDSSTLKTPPLERPLATSCLPVHAANLTNYRLQIERCDGSRLTLQLPNSEWSCVEAFCSLFLRS